MEKVDYGRPYENFVRTIRHIFLNEPLEALESNELYIELLNFSNEHDLFSLVYSGIKDKMNVNQETLLAIEKKASKNLFKSIAQQEEIKLLDEELSKAKIPHCFLKGSILKEYYSQGEFREMSDIDVLVPNEELKHTNDLLINELGYWGESHFGSHHQTYMKKPVYNVEVHYELVDDDVPQFAYYKDFINKLVPEENNPYKLNMALEDYFIFLVYHAFHHFESCGIGLRYIIDLYVFLDKKAKELNMDYVYEEMEKLNILEFFKNSYEVMSNIFNNKEIDDNILEFKNTIIESGTYGSFTIRVQHSMEKKKTSRSKYLFRRLFPTKERMKTIYPVLKKRPYLLPLYYMSRPFKLISVWKTAKEEIKASKVINEQKK